VNEVTAKLFKKYRSFSAYLRAKPEVFEQDIRQTGFYRNKAKNILAAARMVKQEFGGNVPRTMPEMLRIPGVARKTANVVLGNAYGVVEGIAVDTHVKRFAQKFGLTDYADPVRIEKDLMRVIPKKDWIEFTYLAISYGREVCPARRHACEEHPLSKIYPKAAHTWPKR
jgi:endonuclease-3